MDYLICTIILASLIWGFARGFIREIISLVSLFVSVVVATKCAPVFGLSLTWFQSDNIRYLVAFALVFVLALVLGYFVGKLARNMIKLVGLGLIDRCMGACFGALRGALIVSVMLFVVAGTQLRDYPWYQQSRILPGFITILELMDDSFPNHMMLSAKRKVQAAKMPITNSIKHLIARSVNEHLKTRKG